ncbi:hypothetical protein BT67DRAFT_451616 [Trichocladium antarcticum]|uniref:Arrestin C-terminal-like domain-containing protein n=1 Tax=Trichocladium antarcticum TaxID=1450529 RepID=A0AAN6ZA55_9PEZI|nr:hypothetical protein BT67DRAFT_451616 [Trichocladium antarcticum]
MSLRSGTVSNQGGVPSTGPGHNRLRPPPYFAPTHGSVYYSPRRNWERRRRADSGYFPAPLIEPRPRRPHSIHIVSYPSGFVPHELRPEPPIAPQSRPTGRETREEKKSRKKEEKERKRAEKNRSEKQEKRRSLRSLRSLQPGSDKVGRVLEKIFAAFSTAPKPSPPSVSANSTPGNQSRPSSFASFARRLSRTDGTLVAEPVVEEQIVDPPDMAGTTVPNTPTPGAMLTTSRNSIISIRPSKAMASSRVSEIQKPVASGSGLSCSIILAEPNVFLSGFDHDNRARRGGQGTSALLRGKLQLNVSKNVKIKSVTLKLVGKARTDWPEGIPPLKTDFFEEQTLRTQSLLFFHAMYESMWDTEYGSQCTYSHRSSGSPGLMQSLHQNSSGGSIHMLGKGRNPSTLTAKELKRLSLQSIQSRSFGKGESPLANQVQAKGYKIFRPGTYEYAFELPIDHNQLETAKLQYGSIRWELETTVERAGAFKPNLHGAKEVSIVRLPDQMSLEMSEPISISRHWEDQLHYDIVISGKSFPIGGRIPIAFKLTPLAKVQVHKLKVFVTESIEYWTNDRHVTRKDPGRKLLVLEKTAGKPLDKQFAASDVRVLSGGELDPDQREEARRTAARRRAREATRTHTNPQPLPAPSENLLGDLDLGLESFWGSTEIEMNVQLPTCEMMACDKTLRLHPDCSWKNVNVYHWIKLVMRISRADPDDPAGKRRRHFEISIDSPFTVLNCRATQANTALPEYSDRDGPRPGQRRQMSCGCPDAHALDQASSGMVGSLPLIEEDLIGPGGRRLRLDCLPPSQAAAARLAARQGSALNGVRGGGAWTIPMDQEQRPIHLIRHPSHNPPAFDADEPPPPHSSARLTPPPRYDLIVGTPSVDGLADYFARRAAYENVGESGASSSPSDTDTPGASTGLGTAPTSGQVTSVNLDEVTADPFDNIRGPAPGSTEAEPQPTADAEPVSGGDAEAETDAAADADADADDDSSASDSAEDDAARPHRRGRVNVANPRTPGGRLVPSRSMEFERPVVRLDMASVLRRRNDG